MLCNEPPNPRSRRASPRIRLAFVAGATAVAALAPGIASAGELAEAAPPTATQRTTIVYAREQRERPPPLSPLDLPPRDEGIAGARLGVNDNNTTGRFLKQEFALEAVEHDKAPELIAEVRKRVEAGAAFVVADMSPP